MIDILYLTFNRLAFTAASLAALKANTDWSKVRRIVIYDDGSTDGTLELVRGYRFPVWTEVIETGFGSPVEVMNHFLTTTDPAPIFAKIDSDVMLPPGWLGECLAVMDENPELDLLGIEAMHPVGDAPRAAEDAEFIGGIGLMRTRAFTSLPVAEGRFGFTGWQDRHAEVKKAWLNPAMPVCLLDRIPFQPWRALSISYITAGWQRPWDTYDAGCAALWEWWAK